MSQPVTVLLTLLVGTAAAAAQPYPLSRVPQQRAVFLASTPDAPVPEVYVAPGFLTTLVLEGPLERASVVLDAQVTNFALVDVGDRTLALEPRGEWSPQKRLGLKVRLKDGTHVALVVTSHPTQVDGRVNVARPRSAEPLLVEIAQLEAQLTALKTRCGLSGPASWVRQGLLDATGVRASSFGGEVPARSPSGLELKDGVGYRGNTWALVVVWLRNLPGQKPWAPGKARLFGAGGREVPVLAVQVDGPLLPGEVAPVFIDAQLPPDAAGDAFRLELSDSRGERPVSIQGVKL